jgi:hypothetical protein
MTIPAFVCDFCVYGGRREWGGLPWILLLAVEC